MLKIEEMSGIFNISTMILVALIVVFLGFFVYWMIRKRNLADEEVKREYHLGENDNNNDDDNDI